jgi:hypothetical protein
MRAMTDMSDADVNAIRSAFNAVLNAMPEDKLRTLILELLLAGLTPPAPVPAPQTGKAAQSR